MGSYGGYFKGEKKKLKKERLERQAAKIKHANIVPKVEITGKGKGK